jgi:hypothetical protein
MNTKNKLFTLYWIYVIILFTFIFGTNLGHGQAKKFFIQNNGDVYVTNSIILNNGILTYNNGNLLVDGGTIEGGTGIWNHVATTNIDMADNDITNAGNIYCDDIFAASNSIYLGEGKLSYEGGTLKVDDSPVGGGDGGVTSTWETVWISSGAMYPGYYNPPQAVKATFAGRDPTYDFWAFDWQYTNENAIFTHVFPDGWNKEEPLNVKLYWTPSVFTGDSEGAPNDRYIGFWVSAVSFIDGGDADDSNIVTPGTGDVFVIDSTFDNGAEGMYISTSIVVGVHNQHTNTPGNMVYFQLTRDHDFDGGGTKMSADCGVHGLLIRYKKNMVVTDDW